MIKMNKYERENFKQDKPYSLVISGDETKIAVYNRNYKVELPYLVKFVPAWP